MKKASILCALVALLMGCDVYTGIYKVGLQEVEAPAFINGQPGESRIVKISDSLNTYVDELIGIKWLTSAKEFVFYLTNKSKWTMMILWDQAVYVDEKGYSERVFHSGVKLVDKNSFQTPTVIVKGTMINDMIMPTGKVNFVSGQNAGWVEAPLFENNAKTPEEFAALKKKYVGSVVKILLPIKIEGKTIEYLFTFKVKDLVRSWNAFSY